MKTSTYTQLFLSQEQIDPPIAHSIAQGDKERIVSVLFDFAHEVRSIFGCVPGAGVAHYCFISAGLFFPCEGSQLGVE